MSSVLVEILFRQLGSVVIVIFLPLIEGYLTYFYTHCGFIFNEILSFFLWSSGQQTKSFNSWKITKLLCPP